MQEPPTSRSKRPSAPGLLASAALLLVAGCSTQLEPVLAPEPEPTGPAALQAHVEFLTTLDPPRSYGNPEALDRAAQYLALSFEAAGGRVDTQTFEVGGAEYSNVSCSFGPSSGARLVIGAHYDSFGDLPGADDNASGTAVLLALAHEIAELKLTRPVELVAYSLEEPPQYESEDMGSARHARLLVDQETEVYGMLCLEMLGYYSDEPDSQAFPVDAMSLLYGTTGDFLAVVGRTSDQSLVDAVHGLMQSDDLRVLKVVAPAGLEGVSYSDHRNYWAAGFDAVMITDTAFFRNPNYHQSSDTSDTLDYDRMSVAVDRLRAVVAELAGAR